MTVYQHARTKRVVKQGGNIVSYMCTPEGRVIHAIPGAPGSGRYAEGLALALELSALADDPQALRARHARLADTARWNRTSSGLLRVHAGKPLGDVERHLFESLTGQSYAPDAELSVQVLDDEAWANALPMRYG